MLERADADPVQLNAERPGIIGEPKLLRGNGFGKAKAQADPRPDPRGRRDDDAPIAARDRERPATDRVAASGFNDDFAGRARRSFRYTNQINSRYQSISKRPRNRS